MLVLSQTVTSRRIPLSAIDDARAPDTKIYAAEPETAAPLIDVTKFLSLGNRHDRT